MLAHKIRTDENIEGFKMNNLTHSLELYADDCSIFMEAKDESLRKTVETLDNFYKISGLKISVSKTKAVWFGIQHNNPPRLCPDLPLDWDNKFRLLGVDFFSNLEGMDCNFLSKMEEIRKVLNCWIYRTLTIYGKIVVVKTLALSKLSHLPLVLPDLNSVQLKQLENIIFSFLWGNKPDKVSRDHSKLSEKAGGLGVIDIKCFWQALKFSWIRRLLNTNAFWPKILCEEIKSIIGGEVTICDILQLGPNYLSFIGKKLKNQFWKQILCSVGPIMQGALFCHPENIVTAPLWDNPHILRNNKPLKRTFFPGLSEKITTISDFFHPGTNIYLTREEMEQKYTINMSNETFIEFQYIFKVARRNLGLNDEIIIPIFLPFQPLLIKIANLVKKGCNVYYKLLRKKINLKTSMAERESKWHLELNCVYGVDFWNKTYDLTAAIKNDNKIKFLQFQINRNSLFTNYRVNKFKNNISPFCTFCQNNDGIEPPLELVSHLFYECNLVFNIWIQVKNWLETLNVDISLDKQSILFGYHNQSNQSVQNFVILCVKYFIWKSKFQSQDLLFNSFKKYFKSKLEDLKNAYFFENKDHLFEPWLNIYDNLLE